jgi:heme/copper-type cytochrome/quinol oxidase subunit 3
MSGVARRAEAGGGGGATAAALARGRRAIPNGIWGALLFVATETALFGTLIGSYFYLRFTSSHWPQGGVAPPSVALPLALTAALVLTTLPVLLAARAAREGRRGAAIALIALALVVQAGYLAWQIVLLHHDLQRLSPRTTAYGSIYVTLLVLHHAHVAVGLLLDGWLIARLSGGLTRYRITAAQVLAIYWAFVNAVAIAVVATQVSPS